MRYSNRILVLCLLAVQFGLKQCHAQHASKQTTLFTEARPTDHNLRFPGSPAALRNVYSTGQESLLNGSFFLSPKAKVTFIVVCTSATTVDSNVSEAP